MAELWLLRHGQAGAIWGDYDRLSERGWAQMERAGERWGAGREVHLVRLGGMRRHRESLEAFSRSFGALPEAQSDAGWDEFDHQAVVRVAMEAGLGPEEGDGRAAALRFFRRCLARWASGQHDADYAEPYPAFQARVEAALERALEGLGPDERGLIFTSGGVIAACCRRAMGLSPEVAFDLNLALYNSSRTRLHRGPSGRAHLGAFNITSHLDGEPELLTSL